MDTLHKGDNDDDDDNNNNNDNNNFWQYANTFVEITVNLRKRSFNDEVKSA